MNLQDFASVFQIGFACNALLVALELHRIASRGWRTLEQKYNRVLEELWFRVIEERGEADGYTAPFLVNPIYDIVERISLVCAAIAALASLSMLTAAGFNPSLKVPRTVAIGAVTLLYTPAPFYWAVHVRMLQAQQRGLEQLQKRFRAGECGNSRMAAAAGESG